MLLVRGAGYLENVVTKAAATVGFAADARWEAVKAMDGQLPVTYYRTKLEVQSFPTDDDCIAIAALQVQNKQVCPNFSASTTQY